MQDLIYFFATIDDDRFATVLIRYMVCDRYCHIQVSSRGNHIDNTNQLFISQLNVSTLFNVVSCNMEGTTMPN
jgi:hypothetical protein